MKLMGALGAWLGPLSTLLVFFLSTVFAVLGTVGLAAADLMTQGYGRTKNKYLPSPSARNTKPRARNVNQEGANTKKRRLMPYAAPVALATWLLLAWRMVQIQG